MNTCIICQTKQAAQAGICRTCGFPLRLPKFLSNMQYASWMSEEITPRRNQWSHQQKQQELTAQEIAELKQAVAELQKQNLALTAAIQELPELKRTVAELQKQLQSSPQPTQASVSPAVSPQKPVQPPVQETQVSADKTAELTPQQADYIVSSTVTAIRDKAFWGKSFKTVYVPDSVKIIGNAAFKSCFSMYNIRLSDNLQEIGDSAFSNCTELQEIYLPNTVTKIGNSAFSDCTRLQKIHLPDYLTQIGDSVFAYCTSLQEIHLPESLTKIGHCAFENCSSLHEIYLPKTITEISNSAFKRVHAMIYYPQTPAMNHIINQDYGGTLIWRPY